MSTKTGDAETEKTKPLQINGKNPVVDLVPLCRQTPNTKEVADENPSLRSAILTDIYYRG